jgi:hypothetical protein
VSRRAVVAATTVIAMLVWTALTLGLRALIMDPACGGAACDAMREQAATVRTVLLIAWAAGMMLGTMFLVSLGRRESSR